MADFPPGTMLGHFRLEEKIDEGAMGVVYRAWNTRLECDVAVKVLPVHALADAAARRRFHKEALALSKLNSPWVATVHDFDTQDGIDFLVMEFVPGITLRDKLADGPMRERDILKLGVHLAEGLVAAHGHGLVHCDIKPGNLRITPDDQLKILDFGLARQLRVASGTSTTQSTASSGGIAGTPPYMAPEQFDGVVDFRTDIYAAGAVLYEMSTGEPPFRQSESQRLLHAILTEPPVPPRHLNPTVSLALDNIVMKCLEKDPARRYQSARELKVDLERQLTPSYPKRGEEAEHEKEVDDEEEHDGVVTWRRVLVAVGLAAAIVVAYFIIPRPPPPPAPPPSPHVVVTWPGVEPGSRLSPDAKSISFVAAHAGQKALWVQRLSGGEPQPIVTLVGSVGSHIWSPDGEEIALLAVREEGVLLQFVPAFGGSARRSAKLDPGFVDATLAAWVHSHIYIDVRGIRSPRRGLWRFDVPTGQLQHVAPARMTEETRLAFDVCPDETKIAFTLVPKGHSRICVSKLDGSDLVPLSPDTLSAFGARWIGPTCSDLTYSSNESGEINLWRISLATGARHQITFSDGIQYVEDTSRDGRALSFRQDQYNAHLWRLDPRQGKATQLTADRLPDSWPSASSDAHVLTFQRSRPSATLASDPYSSEILLADFGSNEVKNPRVLVADGGGARLSPDGGWLAYVKRGGEANYELWVEEMSTADAWRVAPQYVAPRLYPFPEDWVESNLAWSFDSSELFWTSRAPSGGEEICRQRPRLGRSEPQPVVTDSSKARLGDPYVSHDGRWLAYVRRVRREPGLCQVVCTNLQSGSSRVLITYPGLWRGDLLIKGWLDNDRGLVVLRTVRDADVTEHVEVIETDLAGGRHVLGLIEHAFGGTACLDPRSRVLYLTKCDDQGLAHNVYAFHLLDATLHRLTDNRIPGISFSGLEILLDGSLVFSQCERNQGIYLLRFGS